MPDPIRPCTERHFEEMLDVINDAARAYKGVIPDDQFKDPYIPPGELRHEIQHGVRFWGLEREGELLGVMGLQDVEDVTLIRHAYVRTSDRRRGIGTQLLKYLQSRTSRPLLVGTWAATGWAVRFYCQHGFALVSRDQISLLLRRYWSVPERQIATSVVLADRKWLEAMGDHR